MEIAAIILSYIFTAVSTAFLLDVLTDEEEDSHFIGLAAIIWPATLLFAVLLFVIECLGRAGKFLSSLTKR